jgi:hypothetical protein
MRGDRWASYGARAGAVAVALFVAGAAVIGERPAFDAAPAEVASQLGDQRTRIQLGCGLIAVAAPLFVWFLATVASLTRDSRPPTRRAGAVLFGCGLAFLALFLVDVTTLAAAALRPENMTAVPELATTLRDLEFLAMGMAAPLVSGMLGACAVLALRDEAVWPRWVGWLAAVAAFAYALRVGTLFTVEGAFAADGALGLWAPVIAFAGWTAVSSLVLAFKGPRQPVD